MSEGSPTSSERCCADRRDPSWRLSPDWPKAHRALIESEIERFQSTRRYLLGKAILSTLRRPWRVRRSIRRVLDLRGREATAALEQRVPASLQPLPDASEPVGGAAMRRAREQVRESWTRLVTLQASPENRLGEWLVGALPRLYSLPTLPLALMRLAKEHRANPGLSEAPPPPIEIDYPFGAGPIHSERTEWGIAGPEWLVDMACREPGCRRLVDAHEPPAAVLLALQGDAEPAHLARVLELQRQGSRVAVWSIATGSRELGPATRELLSIADAVVADEVAGVEALHERLGRSVELLAPAVQPRLHNPIGWWARGAGPVADWEKAGTQPKTWQALFSAARGLPLAQDERLLCQAVLQRDIRAMRDDPGNHAALQDRFVLLRHIQRQATLAARLSRLRDLLGLASVDLEPALVSVVVSTNRPHRLADVIDSFVRQTYANKELVLVLHGDGFSSAEVERLVRDRSERIRILLAPQAWSLGRCVQHGVDQSCGSFISKMDDDDFYGRSFLADLLMAMQFSCAGIVCKPCYVVRVEGREGLRLCREKLEYEYGWFSAGASLVMRREVFEQIAFAHLPRGEDRTLCRDAFCLSIPVLAADRFNFVVQRRDVAAHTWKISADLLLESHGAKPLPAGLSESDLDV